MCLIIKYQSCFLQPWQAADGFPQIVSQLNDSQKQQRQEKKMVGTCPNAIYAYSFPNQTFIKPPSCLTHNSNLSSK